MYTVDGIDPTTGPLVDSGSPKSSFDTLGTKDAAVDDNQSVYSLAIYKDLLTPSNNIVDDHSYSMLPSNCESYCSIFGSEIKNNDDEQQLCKRQSLVRYIRV